MQSTGSIARPKLAACAVVVMFAGLACQTGGDAMSEDGFAGVSRRSSGRGAPWTIMCMEIRDPRSHEAIQQIAESLKGTPGIDADEVYTVDHGDGISRLYYGTYHRKLDAKTGKREIPTRLREDLKLIKQLGDDQGRYFFRQALTVRKPEPPAGRPEWSLDNADGKYSLQVAVFLPTDTFYEYKAAAAEYCEYLRREGHEAYYLHGDTSSIVTVGSFGPDAVVIKRQPLHNEAGALTGYAEVNDVNDEVRTLQSKKLFRYNLINGAVERTKIGGKKTPPAPSMLVEIPNDRNWR